MVVRRGLSGGCKGRSHSKNVCSNMSFFQRGGGDPTEPKVLRHFFSASNQPKGGGVRANPKVLRQF